jgi:hypothetical protein
MNRLGLRFKNENKKHRRKLILSWILFVFLLITLFSFPSQLTVKPPEQEPKPEPQLQVIEGSVKEKSTLYESLVEKKIPIRWIALIVSELKPHVNFNKIGGGTYRLVTDMEGKLVRFLFEKSPTEVYKIEKTSQGYITQRQEVSLERYLVSVEGEIRSSLYEAMNAAGEEDPLALSFAEILAWEIDFYQDLREGDRFKVLVEKIYKGEQFIQYGMIRGVEYEQGGKIIRGIWYQGHYYDEEGVSLKRPFSRPLSDLTGSVRGSAVQGGTPSWEVFDLITESIMRLRPEQPFGRSRTEWLFLWDGTADSEIRSSFGTRTGTRPITATFHAMAPGLRKVFVSNRNRLSDMWVQPAYRRDPTSIIE